MATNNNIPIRASRVDPLLHKLLEKRARLIEADARAAQTTANSITTKVSAGNFDASTIGFFGTTPIARPSVYTQTYATADKTHDNVTSADLSLTSTQSTPWGFSSQAEADSIQTQVNALRAELIDLKQLVNAILDDLQALGLLQ